MGMLGPGGQMPPIMPQMPQGPMALQNSFSASPQFQGQLGAMAGQQSPGFQPPPMQPPQTLATGMPAPAAQGGTPGQAGNPMLHMMDQGSIMHRAGLTPFGLEDLFG